MRIVLKRLPVEINKEVYLPDCKEILEHKLITEPPTGPGPGRTYIQVLYIMKEEKEEDWEDPVEL